MPFSLDISHKGNSSILSCVTAKYFEHTNGLPIEKREKLAA